MRSGGRVLLMTIALAFGLSDAAWAHSGAGMAGGFASGFTHPLLGWDHVIAMVAVGLWCAVLGRTAVRILPVVFPLVMAFGGALGVEGVPLPGVEFGIALSAIVLGYLVASAARPPIWLAAILVGAFAIFHGYAHGAELPHAANPVAYTLGFLIATGLLHLSGIAMGRRGLALICLLMGPTIALAETATDNQTAPPEATQKPTPRPSASPRDVETPSPPAESESVPRPDEPAQLKPIVIRGRGQDQVGIADSASSGEVGAEQLETRPILRNAELLEVIPGLIATQHSGSGKANQYFLRGFNLDHGSDFAVSIDGVPWNLPTHAHGQGYLDLNSIIPELVRTVRYNKGPYYADVGDFASAGSAHIELFDRLDRGFAKLEGGMYGFGRAVVANSSSVAGGDFLYAADFTYSEGPWKLDEDALKGNALLKWTRGDSHRGMQLAASAYAADWDATDQIPLRAVRDGSISRRGNVDPTDGGDSSRYTLYGRAWGSGDHSRTKAELFASYYSLDLFSNFTYFLDDPIHGDQIHQHDRRGILGGNYEYDFFGKLGIFDHDSCVGVTLRNDYIPSVALRHSESRQLIDTVREDDVNETSLALWGESTLTLADWLRAVPGLRLDGYRFDVNSEFAANSGTDVDGIASPKFALIAGPWESTEGYFNFGMGYHSNDARGVTIQIDPGSGDPVHSVDPLVRSYGYELGARTEAIEGLHSSVALWLLDLDSELVFVGDAGTTEPGPPSRRYGVEFANYYQPFEKTALDFDLSWTHARFEDVPKSENEIPGAIPLVITAGVTQRLPYDLYTALRFRYLGEYPLTESGDQDSGSTTLVNLRLGWEQPPASGAAPDTKGNWGAYIDFLNLFDSHDRDIAYYYESRLQGEATGVEDIHFHPVEPFQVRVGLERRF